MRTALLFWLAIGLAACTAEPAADPPAPGQDAGPNTPTPDAVDRPEDVPTPQPDAPAPDVSTPQPDTAPDVEDVPEEDVPPVGENGCGRIPETFESSWTLQQGGTTRRFVVHLPPNYDPNTPTPVVIGFHGRTLDAAHQIVLSGMHDLADAEGFIAVHPEGTASDKTWNAGILCCGDASRDDVDDVGFVSDMLDALDDGLCIDERRIFATGISNGGFISHRLACELSDRIAAIASVAGVNLMFECNPTRPVPMFHFHGTNDLIVPYDGYLGVASVEQTVDLWTGNNGCTGGPEVFFEQDDVRCERWTPCNENAEVQLCTVEDGGHTWPGASIDLIGRTTDTISATEMMWDFFKAHPRP